MTQPFRSGYDRRPQGIDSDPPRRKVTIVVIAAAVLVGVGAVLTLLGIPWWVTGGFAAFVLLLIMFTT